MEQVYVPKGITLGFISVPCATNYAKFARSFLSFRSFLYKECTIHLTLNK